MYSRNFFCFCFNGCKIFNGFHLPKVMTPTKRHERGNRIALEEKDETCSFEGASSEIIIDKSKQIALYSLNRHLDLEIISFVEFVEKNK